MLPELPELPEIQSLNNLFSFEVNLWVFPSIASKKEKLYKGIWFREY